jgi:preprotein translocase subunit SecE
MANPFEFLQEVRQEAAKVKWPNRRETMTTTILVVLMCVIASLFLAVTDQLIHLGINFLLGFGR